MTHKKPEPRWQRILWLVAAWVLGVPFFWMLFLIMGPWSLILLALSLWASWDYLKSGGMAESVDRVSRVGAWMPNALERKHRK